MSEEKLDALKKAFNPKRTYHAECITTEIDGIFVRVDDGLADRRQGDELGIPVEDFLQDAAIIRSARVSTGRDTKEVDEKAAGLIGALYKGNHVTPFEGAVMFRLRVTVPIHLAQPFFLLPGSHNEFSGRYSVIDGDFYTPKFPLKNPEILSVFQEAGKDSQYVYKSLLKMGVAKEQARFALLFRFQTKFFWTVSLRHLLELMALEKNSPVPEAFWQWRDEIIPQILKDWTPWTYEKVRELQKKIPTQWKQDFLVPEDIWGMRQKLEIGALDSGKTIRNIGKIFLLRKSGNTNLFRLGTQTKLNPARGFGHGSMTFLIDTPIFVHRQWVRHRNSIWSELPVDFDRIVKDRDFYIPLQLRKQIGKSMAYVFEDMSAAENDCAVGKLRDLIERSCGRYHYLRSLGVSAEDAALNLPYLFRISTLWTVNLEGLMNFFSLRCDTHAQWEIRQYADEIYPWFKQHFPEVNEVFLKHLNYGQSDLFSRP